MSKVHGQSYMSYANNADVQNGTDNNNNVVVVVIVVSWKSNNEKPTNRSTW